MKLLFYKLYIISLLVSLFLHWLLLHYPVMLRHFSPAPVKTDWAVRIQSTNQVKVNLSSINQSTEKFTMKVYAWLIDWFCTFPGKLPYGYNSRVDALLCRDLSGKSSSVIERGMMHNDSTGTSISVIDTRWNAGLVTHEGRRIHREQHRNRLPGMQLLSSSDGKPGGHLFTVVRAVGGRIRHVECHSYCAPVLRQRKHKKTNLTVKSNNLPITILLKRDYKICNIISISTKNLARHFCITSYMIIHNRLFTLYCPVMFNHFLDPPGNHPRRAIFPEMCKINQSIKRRLSW